MGNVDRLRRGDASCVLGVGPTPLARGFGSRRWLLLGGHVGLGCLRRVGSVQLGVADLSTPGHRIWQLRVRADRRRNAAPR